MRTMFLLFVVGYAILHLQQAIYDSKYHREEMAKMDSIYLELAQYNKNLEDIKMFIFKDGSLFLDRSRIKVGYRNFLYYKPGGLEDGK